jgi:hypothetical protein
MKKCSVSPEKNEGGGSRQVRLDADRAHAVVVYQCPLCDGDLFRTTCARCCAQHFECSSCDKEVALDVRGYWHLLHADGSWEDVQ